MLLQACSCGTECKSHTTLHLIIAITTAFMTCHSALVTAWCHLTHIDTSFLTAGCEAASFYCIVLLSPLPLRTPVDRVRTKSTVLCPLRQDRTFHILDSLSKSLSCLIVVSMVESGVEGAQEALVEMFEVLLTGIRAEHPKVRFVLVPCART